MRMSRGLILFVLAGLTICFLGASYAMWFNASSLALMGTDNTPSPEAAATVGNAEAVRGVRLVLSKPGIAAVTASQLRSAGLPFIELSPHELSLTYNGQQVPFLVHDLNGESALFFYAQAVTDAHAPQPVYMLEPGEGTLMRSRTAATEAEGQPVAEYKMVWEENAYFVENAQGEDAWMGPLLLAPTSWSMNVDDVSTNGGKASLVLHLFSDVESPAEPDHQITVLVNGRSAGEYSWDGIGPHTITISLPNGVLQSSDNSLEIVLHENPNVMGESIFLNSLEMDYDSAVIADEEPAYFASKSAATVVRSSSDDLLIFDITNEHSPEMLTDVRSDRHGSTFDSSPVGRHYVALPAETAQQPTIQTVTAREDSLRDPRWAADYIAIVADVRGFPEALQPLMEQRKEQGLRVAAVPLEQVFDEFGYGHRDPEAIKSFLEYAVQNWQPPAPRYVLLVGDATYDLTDQTTGRNRNRLPTEMVHENEAGYIASDAWFADFGGQDEPLQIAIGRFPAQNTPQLSIMVEKTLAYESDLVEYSQDWSTDVLLVQDEDPAYQRAAQRLAQELGSAGFHVYRLQEGRDQTIRHSVVSAINQGVGLISYVGRGSDGAWGDGGALQNSDVQSLSNAMRLPILTTFTCRSASFASPQSDSLAEALLRASGGGIIAAVAPTGNIPDEQQVPLAEAFQDQYLSGEHERLGDVLLGLYTAVNNQPQLVDALSAVSLLGDPALRLYHLAP